MRDKKKFARNLLIFFSIIIITFYIIFKDQSITSILEIIRGVKIEYVLIAICAMMMYFVCESINLGRTLRALGEKSNFFKNIIYVLIGFFFSSVTPAASGGQPMQVYYMHKDNISVANSTLALLMNLMSMQIATISMALISFCFNANGLSPVLIGFFILGITLNASALSLLIIAIVSKRMTRGLINIFIKILKFFKIKNIDNIQEKIEKELEKYQESAKYIKANKRIILKTVLTTYVQFLLYYSISYFVYRSFGLSSKSIFEIITIQSVLYATVSGIPSPGAVGVTEGGFLEIFKRAYPEKLINSAMLLNRGINFYLFVIISSFIVIVCTMKEKKEHKAAT